MSSNRLAGRRIQQHRVQLRLSPEQYGLRIGVAGMTVRRIEEGKTPFLSTAGKFADDMGLAPEDLWPGYMKARPARRHTVAA